MDVCINKPFKAILRKCWVDYVSEIVDKKLDKIPPPSRQNMVDWVEKVFNAISLDTEMVKRSFEVCGITITDKAKVRNGAFYKSCMENACKHLDDDAEAEDDYPFTL